MDALIQYFYIGGSLNGYILEGKLAILLICKIT